MTDPTNGTRYRLDNIERRLQALEDAEVAVIAEKVTNIEEQQKDFRDQVRGEMHSLHKLVREQVASVDKKVDKQGDTLAWVLRIFLGIGATVVGAILLYGITGGAGAMP